MFRSVSAIFADVAAAFLGSKRSVAGIQIPGAGLADFNNSSVLERRNSGPGKVTDTSCCIPATHHTHTLNLSLAPSEGDLARTRRDDEIARKLVAAPKQKRFRRTKEEVRRGLSIQEAALKRGVEASVTAPAAVPLKELRITPAENSVPSTIDLTDSLAEPARSRARAMSLYRARNHKGPVTTETLDMISAYVSSGKITKCPPCLDSEGFDHLNKTEVR